MRKQSVNTVLLTAVVVSFITACSNKTSNLTPIADAMKAAEAEAPPPVPPAPVDWTGKSCESPAYENILGSYAGSIRYGDENGRSCLWNAEITIVGVSTDTDCLLSGNVTATAVEQGATDAVGYHCDDMNAGARYVVGIGDEDLNRFRPSSVIVHFDANASVAEIDGKRLHPVFQYQSLTAEGEVLSTGLGDALNRQ